MANLSEWAKGIGLFLFTTIMFYFYWDNIFMNLINWCGTDFICAGESACTTALATSFTVLKTMAWISFIMIYLLVSPLYLIYAIIAGSRNDVETHPIELIKGLGAWAISMPFMMIILGVIYRLIATMETATSGLMSASDISTASNFGWIITLLALIGIMIYPFICIIKGYGMNENTKVLEAGVNG